MDEEIIQTTFVDGRGVDGSVERHRYDLVRIDGGLAVRFTDEATGETRLSPVQYRN